MSALHRKVADATVRRKKEEESKRWDYPWPPGAFNKACDAIRNGTWEPSPPIRHPVLLTPNGPISSASKLQKLAETESLPEVIATSQVGLDGREIKKVTISHVSHDEWERMGEKAEVSTGIEEHITVMFNGKRRIAWIVKALKEGVTLGDEDEEGSVSGTRVAGSSAVADLKPGRC